jgi:CcmD family protein
MRRLMILVVLLLLAPAAVEAQALPGPACGPGGFRSESNTTMAAPSVSVEGGNQKFTASWQAVEAVAGYQLRITEGANVMLRETSGTSCLVSATNGRTYTVELAVVLADDERGPFGPAVTVTPAFEGDALHLAAGLLVVWLGLAGYAAFLQRQQRILSARDEALLNERQSPPPP